MPSICVIVPTFNEKNNLPIITRKIFDLKIPNLGMLVVDDNSPDGTGAIADALAHSYPLRVLHREKKEGLGRAYVAAFHYLLSGDKKPDIVIHLDADLSHDVAAIPLMLGYIKEYDVVVGSRYVPGGKVMNEYLHKRIISRLANIYARIVLWMPYRDMTSGFKCYRRGALEGLVKETLSSIGYFLTIETLYKAHHRGYKIKEMPIFFAVRHGGKSKMDFPVIAESFWRVLALRLSAKGHIEQNGK